MWQFYILWAGCGRLWHLLGQGFMFEFTIYLKQNKCIGNIMDKQSYYDIYEQLELLQSHPSHDFKLWLVREKPTGLYRAAKKTSILECTDESQDKILNEVQILKQLSNPHITKYHNIYLQQDTLIVIVQFCEEGDLEYYLIRKKQKKQALSEKLILSWVLQLLMGLQYIHAKNIIHRLVTSRNVYLNHQGDLKLGSFGGARMLESTMDKAITVVGAPCNLSPEVVEGKPYDSKIDIWGLGCLIYQLATHQHPFKLSSLPQLYQQITKWPPQDLPQKYSKHLNPIYKKMLKKNPNFRPSASQLLQEEVFIRLMAQYTRKKKIDSLDLREITPKHLLTHVKRVEVKRFPPLAGGKMGCVGNAGNAGNAGKGSAMKKKYEVGSRSREKENSMASSGGARLPSLSGGRASDSQEEVKFSPKQPINQQKTALPSVHKQKKFSSQLSKHSSPGSDCIKQKKEQKSTSPKEQKSTSPKEQKSTSPKEQIEQKQQKPRKQQKIPKEQKPPKQQKASKQQRPPKQQKQPQKQDRKIGERLTLPDAMQGQYISILCQVKLELLQKKYSPNMSQIFEQTIEFQEEEEE